LGPKQNALWLLEQDIQTFEDLKNASGQIQSAVKCRGRECLRINYGPEYTAVENLERLRARGLSTKRSLALREFALGIEAIERFVRKEPLRRVHEAVFSVLALESEPVGGHVDQLREPRESIWRPSPGGSAFLWRAEQTGGGTGGRGRLV
jgi:hypothetical protein